MKINTVLGTIDSKDMGVTLMHEHISTIEWNFARAFPGFFDKEEAVRLFCEEMELLKPYGLKTFVDATPITLGRNIDLMRECSERAEINIIAATGMYGQEFPFFGSGVHPRVLADLMIKEIENGMEGTDAKPAFIKCATQEESEINGYMIWAAAIASRETGLPIYAHTNPHKKVGRFQKEIFDREGIEPKKVAYGHTVGTLDMEYFKDLAHDGSYLGNDQISYAGPRGIGKLADMTMQLIGEGFGKQVFLSCDNAVRSDFGMVLMPELRDRDKNPMVRRHGIKDTLFDGILPALRERGLDEDGIRELMELNPRRFFGEEI